MSKATNRKIKYNLIRNYTYDAELATKGRDWSWKKINQELGLQKLDKAPRLKPIPKSVDRYLQVTEVYRQELVKKNAIDQYRFAVNLAPKQRKERWSQFSEKGQKEIPDELNLLANQINLKYGFDPNDSYGFAVIFYAFTEDKSIKDVELLMQRDRHDGDIYLYNARIR